MVGTRRAEVDDGDRATVREHPVGEHRDRVDLQAGAAADDEVATRELCMRLLKRGREHLAEEDDRRLQVLTARGAERDGSTGAESNRGDLLRATEPARQAFDLRQRPVQLERRHAAG